MTQRISRRSIVASLLFAPAIVRASSLMALSPVPPLDQLASEFTIDDLRFTAYERHLIGFVDAGLFYGSSPEDQAWMRSQGAMIVNHKRFRSSMDERRSPKAEVEGSIPSGTTK